MRRKQLGLHHGVDRRIAGDDHQRAHHQQAGDQRAARRLQRGEDRIGQQHARHPERDHQRFPPDPVRQRTRHRLEQHEHEQRDRIDLRCGLAAEPGCIDQELLHVDRIGIEGERPAGGQQHHGRGLARMPGHQLQETGLGRTLRLRSGKALRLGQPAAEVEHHHRQHAADRERDAPAPGVQIALRHRRLQDQQHADRQQLAGNQRDILEAREEPAPVLARHLGQIGGARAIFAAHRQSLHQPRDHQQRRGHHPDRLIARRHRDQQRSRAHQRHGQRQPGLAPLAIGIDAHDPGADRPHQESDREDRRRTQQLRGPIALGKEMRREIQGECRIDIPVIPFDQIARRSADDRFQPAAAIGGGIAHVGGWHMEIPCCRWMCRNRPANAKSAPARKVVRTGS